MQTGCIYFWVFNVWLAASVSNKLMRNGRDDRQEKKISVTSSGAVGSSGAADLTDAKGIPEASEHTRVEVDAAGESHVEDDDDDRETAGEEGDEPPIKVRRLTPEEHRAFRARALRPHIAEERFHRVFPPWSVQRLNVTREDCDVDDRAQSSRKNVSGAAFDEINPNLINPQRMQNMMTKFTDGIKYADPGSTGCLDIQLDFTSLGIPWLIVSLGIEGTLMRNARTNCVEWRFRTNLGFNFKFFILGADFFFRVSLETSVELQELHCKTHAQSSFYCKYLHLIVQDYSDESRDKCHTDSPFDIILTYLKYQWQSIYNWVSQHIFQDKDSDYFGSPLENELTAIREGLLKYPALFKGAPVEAYPDMGDAALQPKKVKVDGSRSWLWVIEHERRLCWSKNKPDHPQEKVRTDKKLAELRKACRYSIPLSDITPFLDTIELKGNTVVLPLRRALRPSIKIEFDNGMDAAYWRRDAAGMLTMGWSKERTILSSRCVSAALNEEHDPYCILDMPGELWGSSYHHNTKNPNWHGDGIGFHIDGDSHNNFRGELIASVRDMDTNFLEKFWEWLTGNGNDPLEDYIGEARVAVCSDSKDPEWVSVAELSKCDDTIAETQVEGGANECKQTCLRVPGCGAIEFLSDGKCFLFHSACGVSLEEQRVSYDSDVASLFDEVPRAVNEEDAEEDMIEQESEGWWDRRRRRRRAPPPAQPFKLADRGCDIQASTEWHEITLPLTSIDKKSSGMLWWKKTWQELSNAGNVKLTVQLADVPEPEHTWSLGMAGDGRKEATSYPGLVGVAQAMFAALDQYLGKIPDYTKQVLRRLKPYDPNHKQFEDGGLDYSAFDGRYGARWNPNIPEAEEQEDEETYTCPPPDDAGAHHELSCELEGVHDKSGSWWNKLKNRLQDMFTNPPCEGHAPELDDRVVHFARGIHDSKFAKNDATRARFYAELTISMMNLFVRMVGDVQALFSVYFADEPSWDGNCYGLPAEFMLPYEFGIDVSDGEGTNWDPHSKDFSQRVIPERRADGLVSEESSKKMPTDKNPFCKWSWASSRKRQKHRVDFARQDAPVNGRDGYVTAPRDASAHMRPHIWCRVARAYREQQKEDAPFNVNNPNKSRTNLRYRSACQQLKLADYGDKNWTAETRRRYECETTILTPSFVTLFPKFLSRIFGSTSPLMNSGDAGLDVGWFGEIGSIAEDVLQCAGYVTAEMRQFETTLQVHDIDINDICNGGKEHLDSIVSSSGARYSRIEGLVTQWSQKVLAKLRAFAEWLKEKEVTDAMTAEFREAFAYYDLNDHRGTMFTGKAWKAGLTAAHDEMGTATAIESRIQESMDLAVEEAYKDKNGDAAGLFTLPVQASLTYSLSMGFAFELSNLCNLGVTAQIRMNVRLYNTGFTWVPWKDQGNSKICFAGVMAPIHMFYLLIDVEFCTLLLRNGDKEYSWHIRVKSVIFQKNTLKDVFNSTVGKLYHKLTGRVPLKSDMTTGDLNNIIENAAWQFSRKLLLDPELINDVMGIIADATITTMGETAKKLCSKVSKHVQEKLVPMAKEISQMALSNALQLAVTYVIDALTEAIDLVSKEMGIVTVGVKLNSVHPKGAEKGEPWTKSAIVDFQKVKRTTFGVPELPFIGQPGIAGLGFTFKFDQSYRYDFSEAFNSIMQGWGVVGTVFDCCTACLDTLGQGFCSKHKGVPKCFVYYGDPLPCDDGKGGMFRYMDCVELGDAGKAEIDKSVARTSCKATEEDDDDD